MTTLHIHERIAALRKARGMTQEQLAATLGVTNQSVSKWESAQCCPDIQLLPTLADQLGVTIDSLMDHAAEMDALPLGAYLDAQPDAALAPAVLDIAQKMHTAVLLRSMKGEALAGHAEELASQHKPWGYSCYSAADLATVRCRGTVLFAQPEKLPVEGDQLHGMAHLLRILGDAQALALLFAIYHGMEGDETRSVSITEAAEAAHLPVAQAQALLEGPMYVLMAMDGGAWRIKGMYMHLPPLLLLLTQA